MDRCRVTGHQGVPIGQWRAFVHRAVGAGFRYPLEMIGLVGGEYGAVGYQFMAVGVVGAAAGVDIKHRAGDAGAVDFTGVSVFEPVDAALCAAVAQGFPLGFSQLMELYR